VLNRISESDVHLDFGKFEFLLKAVDSNLICKL